jgi:hypothetical protein
MIWAMKMMSDNPFQVTREPGSYAGIKMAPSPVVKMANVAYLYRSAYYVAVATFADIASAFFSCDQSEIRRVLEKVIVVKCGTLSKVFGEEELTSYVDEFQDEKAKTKAQVEAEGD